MIEHKLEQATSNIQRGDREAARTAYQQAVEWATKTDDASLNGAIGRQGSLDGFAGIVKPACERAVELEPLDSAYRDTRALARALTGDYEGAIEDLKFHETQPEADFEKDLLKKRHAWIKILQEKQNPFDEQTLENFKKQLTSDKRAPIGGINSLLGGWVKE